MTWNIASKNYSQLQHATQNLKAKMRLLKISPRKAKNFKHVDIENKSLQYVGVVVGKEWKK